MATNANATLSREDRAALEHEERLREAREHKLVADRIASERKYREDVRRGLERDIGEAETCRTAFMAAARALSKLPEDAVRRCGCGARVSELGVQIQASAASLRPALDASVATALARIERLKSKLAVLPPPE